MMPWYAWYSKRQEGLYGYAHYLNKKGVLVAVTEVSQDPEHKHFYNDSVRLGKVTHFCNVQGRNHNKRRGKEPDKMIPSELKYDISGSTFQPHLILN